VETRNSALFFLIACYLTTLKRHCKGKGQRKMYVIAPSQQVNDAKEVHWIARSRRAMTKEETG
jgi:hypothetical protein